MERALANLTSSSAVKPRRALGTCTECGFLVYMRRDNAAFKHRIPMGAPDQICSGSGYPAKFKRFEDARA